MRQIAATKFCRSDNDFHMSHEAICCRNLSTSPWFVSSCVSAFTVKLFPHYMQLLFSRLLKNNNSKSQQCLYCGNVSKNNSGNFSKKQNMRTGILTIMELFSKFMQLPFNGLLWTHKNGKNNTKIQQCLYDGSVRRIHFICIPTIHTHVLEAMYDSAQNTDLQKITTVTTDGEIFRVW